MRFHVFTFSGAVHVTKTTPRMKNYREKYGHELILKAVKDLKVFGKIWAECSP